ncbi:MAG: PKD domain-containing protein [Planctomycetes bacterium]|nr:PKD domain-containing protein [Planctomycetota bacterium]
MSNPVRIRRAIAGVAGVAGIVAISGFTASADQPPPLRSVPVPEPSNLSQFVTNRDMAIALGKALFWDKQTGGDGQQACASCHFNAGTDGRTLNTVNPGANGAFNTVSGPMQTLSPTDFPFHRVADVFDRQSAVLSDSDDIVGGQGLSKTLFNDIVPGNKHDDGTPQTDATFGDARRVTGRNVPTVLNAIYNYRNFWDGRANFFFNGVNPFGPGDPSAFLLEKQMNGSLSHISISIDNASLASQAVGPPNNPVEMSFDGRNWKKLGKKMLSMPPLHEQLVHSQDSVLGPWSNAPGNGLHASVTYEWLVQQAFASRFWDSTTIVDADGNVVASPTGSTNEFTLMEFNFSLFWGLAIQLYEATLTTPNTPFDRFLEGDTTALTEQQIRGADTFFGAGHCDSCHSGAEFTQAATEQVIAGGLIHRGALAQGDGITDVGFMNIGVRPPGEDHGINVDNPPGRPLSFARLAQLGLISTPLLVGPNDVIAVDGAVKIPTLRNVELTGPYWHTGGFASLEQVVEFYSRGADFHEANLATLANNIDDIGKIKGHPERVLEVASFLRALTDDDVRWERGPFDHPSLCLPNGDELPAIGSLGRDVEGYGPVPSFLGQGGSNGQNLPPVCDAGPDHSCNAGQGVSLSGMGSHDPEGSSMSFTWNFGDGSPIATGPVVNHTFATQGTFIVTLLVSDGTFITSDTTQVVVNPVPPAQPNMLFSFAASTTLPGVGAVTNHDIVRYDPATQLYSMYFRGSDVGLALSRIDAFCRMPNGDLLLSFATTTTVPGLTGGPTGLRVANADIVRFHPTSLGAVTAGTFAFYFDGSDVGLTTSTENVDAIALDSAGNLVLSITGAGAGTGQSAITGSDLVRFTATSLGAVTAGSFSMYFDASDVGLTTSTEIVDAAFIATDGRLYLSTTGNFAVTGATGGKSGILRFAPTNLGANTTGTFDLFVRSTDIGIPSVANVSGFSILP